MEETFLDSVSRWLGYIALTWITYLIYLASGVSIADCVSAVVNPKKKKAPHIQVIPATPNTPDKTFENFELHSVPAPESTSTTSAAKTTTTTTKRKQKTLVNELLDEEDEFVLEAPSRKSKNSGNTDHPTDTVTSECTESAAEETASPETSALVAAAARITSAATAGLCDPMCDATTRFNVTRCSFSVEKLQTLPSIKILTPEDVCPPGTLISGLPGSGNDDSNHSDPPRPTTTTTATTTTTFNNTTSRSESDERSTNLTDHHSPQRSNSDNDGTTQTGRRTGGDDLLVKMLCDIDQVDACHDLRKPRPSIDEPLVASEALELQSKHAQHGHLPRKHHKTHQKQVSWNLSSSTSSEKGVRFALPESDTAEGSDESRSEVDEGDGDDFHESPDSDDEDSEGSPTAQRRTPSRVPPSSPSLETLLKDLSDEALDESAAHIDTNSVLDALLFQNRRRRSLPTVQATGGDYEMVYREKLERQSLGDPDSILTEPSVTPQKFKASLREEDFADLLPPLSPDCGYDSLSEVVSSPDEFECYGSAQQLSIIVEEDAFEEEKNHTVLNEQNTQTVQNGNMVTETPVEAATIISTMNAKHEVVDGKTPSLANRNHFVAPTEDFDNFTTMDNSASFLRAARAGNLEKVLEYLKGSIDINTSNANGLNALHLASKEGHVLVVKELLQRGAEVNAATKKGNTALHIASLAGQADVVQVLVEKGANVNVQSQNGFTPLYMAAQENHDPVVRFLLANNANQSLATEDGFTPLAVALQQGHDKVVAVLLENDAKGKVRLPALHIAAKKDDTKAAALLLQNEHNPDVTSKSGFTPLHIAAHYGNAAIAAQLLDKGADVNFPAKHHISPLHVAAKWGKTNMVKLLLDQGANLDASTRDGLTPLHCAARSGHDQVVDQLIEKGAPITAKTKNGLAPLHMASQGDHVESAKILLNHKAPVDDITVDYLTALHVAAHCGHVGVAKLLLDKKADANSRALNGFTPLHIACKKNRIKVVELLLRHGASIEATTESGLTPLHVASFMGCMNIVIYLIQHGANADVPTVRGETPLHLAARANQTDIVRILLRNGAQVDTRAREQQTPLHIAARLGNVDIVGLLLQHGANVDSATKDLYTSLHIAAKEGQEEVVNLLLDHGASVTAATKKGFTPLHLAAKYGHLKVGKLLLQRDAPVDAQGKNGVTPLHVAAHYDYNNIALLLLEQGGSPHAAAKNGYTPLHIAAKKNQMDIGTTLLEYGAKTNAESKAGFTSLHLAAQEGFADHAALLIEHGANVNAAAKNGLTPLHLCAQEDRVNVAAVLAKYNCQIDPKTAAGYTPLHVACHFGQTNMIKFLLQHGADVNAATTQGYTPLHQAAQQGHAIIINLLLENRAQPNATTKQGQTALSIAEKLGYISVIETLKVVTETTVTTTTTVVTEEKYKVVAPETMHETFMSDSEDEAEQDNMMGDHSFKYLTADEMKSLGDDSLPIDVTRDEKAHEAHVAHMAQQAGHIAPSAVEEDRLSPSHLDSSFAKAAPDNVEVKRTPVHAGFLVSFMVDARGGAMRGCRHSGVRVIIPPRRATMPMRVTCRFIRKEKLSHPPPLMEGEACAARVIEMGPAGAKFLGPVVIEVPHFASLRGKEREIVILRSDNGETWKEHTLEATEDAVSEVLNGSFDAQELNAMQDFNTSRVTRILTTDFPQFFAVVCRNRQEVHSIGPEGGMVSSTVVSQVQAIFPDGALTKKIKVGLQAQPIHTDMVTRLLGNRVAVSPIVTVEPRRRKFHKPITLTIPLPKAAHKGMTNQYQNESPTLRLLCSITGGQTKAQWEDVTGSTPLTFVSECVSFTTTVSARFWLIDCRQITDVTKFATELYHEAVLVPFMAKFVVFAKRHELLEAQLRVFCMTDDREDKTLENQEHFAEVAKSRDVEVLEGTEQYLEFAGNLVPITKSGEQLALTFEAFKENRVSFNARVKDMHQEPMGRVAFMKDPRGKHQDVPQTPVCNLNIRLPEPVEYESVPLEKKYGFVQQSGAGGTHEMIHRADLHLSDIAKEVGNDWAALAGQLGIPVQEIQQIRDEVASDKDTQSLTMLKIWIQRMGPAATGNALEKALQNIGRDDIVHKCMSNIEVVTDDVEKAVAKVHLSGPGSITSVTKTTVITTSSTDERDIMKDAESAEDTSSGSARTKPTATPAPVEVHEVHQTTVDVKHADSKKTSEARKEKLPEKQKADSKKKDPEPKKDDSKKQSPKREIPPPPKKEPPKKEKKEDPPKKDAATAAPKKDAKKEASLKKKEEPKKEASPAPPKKETSPPKKEPSPAPPKKEASPPKKEAAKKEETKKPEPAPKKDSPKKEAPRKEDKKMKSPSAAPPEPPKQKVEERREQAVSVSETVVTEVIQKTELPSTASPQKKREGTPVDELSAELLEQIVRDDQDLALKGGAPKKSARDFVDAGPGGVMGRNVDIERYMKETTPEEIVIPEYRHETRTVTTTSMTTTVTREGVIGELGAALKDFDDGVDRQGPIITEIGDVEAALITEQAKLQQQQPQQQQLQSMPSPDPSAFMQESHEMLPDGTLQHTITKVTTTTFVQEEGQPPVELSTRLHESEAGASDADTSQVSVSSLPEDEGTVSSGLQHMQESLLMGDIMTAAESHTGVQTSVTTRTITEVDYDSEGNPHEKTVTITVTRKVTTDKDGQQHVEETETRS